MGISICCANSNSRRMQSGGEFSTGFNAEWHFRGVTPIAVAA
jgi:hypothetical protein